MKANFDVDQMNVEILLSEKNVLPTSIRHKLFYWWGAGTQVLVTYNKAGLTSVRLFDSI